MSNKNGCFRVILSTLLLVIVIGLMLYGVLYRLFSDWPSTSPTERIRQRTEEIVQSARYPRPTNLYTTMPELDACMDWLADSLKKNRDQYTIIIKGVWGTYASPIPGGTGTITATVDVNFPDGTKVEMDFYPYTLTDCRYTKDELF